MEAFSREIQDLIRRDQENIKLFRQGKISSENYVAASAKLSDIFLCLLERFGFPYREQEQVTEDLYKAAVALALHLDIKQMRLVYKNFIKNTSEEKISPTHRALFIDKIRILSGKKQLYGSQYKIDADKSVSVLPIEDAENVDQRRKKLGLNPLAEYLKSIEIN